MLATWATKKIPAVTRWFFRLLNKETKTPSQDGLYSLYSTDSEDNVYKFYVFRLTVTVINAVMSIVFF